MRIRKRRNRNLDQFPSMKTETDPADADLEVDCTKTQCPLNECALTCSLIHLFMAMLSGLLRHILSSAIVTGEAFPGNLFHLHPFALHRCQGARQFLCLCRNPATRRDCSEHRLKTSGNSASRSLPIVRHEAAFFSAEANETPLGRLIERAQHSQ